MNKPVKQRRLPFVAGLMCVLTAFGGLAGPALSASEAGPANESSLPYDQPLGHALADVLEVQSEAGEPSIEVAQSQQQQAQQPVVTVGNSSSLRIDILYVEDNNYKIYAQVPPGGQVSASAAPGFVIFFGVNNNAIVGQYQITEQPQQSITVTPELLAEAGIPPQDAQGQNPQQVENGGQARPQDQNLPVVSFDNQTGVQVDLLYADRNGTYQVYRQIPSGQRADVPSNVGLVWYFGANDQVFGQYQVNDSPSQPLVLNPGLLGSTTQTQPGPADQSTPGSGGAEKTAGADDAPPPAAPPPVDSSAIDDLRSAPAAPDVSAELEQVAERKVPPRANWNAATWAAGSNQMRAAIVNQGSGFLTVNPHGEVVVEGPKTATSHANWYFEPVGGRADDDDQVFYLRNAAQVDSYVYLDPDNPTSGEVLFGPQGIDVPTGKWRLVNHPFYSDGIFYIMNESAEGYALTADGSTYVKAEHIPDLAKAATQKSWIVTDVPDFKKFFNKILELVPAFQEMSENFAQLEADFARSQEEARLEAERQEKLRKEEILRRVSWGKLSGMRGEVYPFVSTGQKPAFRNERGVIGVEYIFQSDNTPKFENSLPRFEGDSPQSVELVLRPKLFAYVEDDIMFVRVRTEQPSGLNFKAGGVSSSDRGTAKTFYLESARLSVWSHSGIVENYSPLNANTVSDLGRNSERNSGLNVSLQDVGGNFGVSSGVSSNRAVLDYTISSQAVSDPRSGENRGASYGWTACGIAAVVATTDDCLYRSAADLFDERSLSFKPLRPIATTMPLMETDTIFRIGHVDSIIVDHIDLIDHCRAGHGCPLSGPQGYIRCGGVRHWLQGVLQDDFHQRRT